MKLILFFLIQVTLFSAFGPKAAALPEAARYGHFTCTSCHVSPGGGGTLTSYGKEFSEQKLSTWRYEKEENPLNGLLPLSDRYLLGGDLRWVYMNRKVEDQDDFKKFWRMQADLELGVHVDPTWFEPMWLTVAAGTEPAGPMTKEEDADKFKIRGYMLRINTWKDHIIARVGYFIPKFGLMLSDHTAYVRIASGLTPDSEQTQAEIIYQNDMIEVTTGVLVESTANDREGKSKSGFNLGLSGFYKNIRANLNVLSTNLALEGLDMSMLNTSASAVVTMTSRMYGMFEYDRIKNTSKSEGSETDTDSVATFSSLHFELYRGIIPYTRYEYWDSDLSSINNSNSRWGVGANWYPRPHLQTEARVLRTINNRSQLPANQIDVILHYYF